MMKYWKKGPIVGTYEDDPALGLGTIPQDAVECEKADYDAFIADQPATPAPKKLKDILLIKGVITQADFDQLE